MKRAGSIVAIIIAILLFGLALNYLKFSSPVVTADDRDPKKIIGNSNHLLEAADLKTGRDLLISCKACHSTIKGEPHKLGPNLYGVVGARVAGGKKYDYSEALIKRSDQYWTIDNLDDWLKDPQNFAPGTTMSFEGLHDPQDRMDLIAYLKSLEN